MGHASQEALKVARKWVSGQPAQSPLVDIGYPAKKGRRVTANGDYFLSYGWWTAAYRDEDGSIHVTNNRYQTGTWKSGKPKYSPTTDGHIAAVREELGKAGYEYVESSPHGEWDTYRKREA